MSAGVMRRLFLLFLLCPLSLVAQGTCPSGNNTITPTGTPISFSSLGVTTGCWYVSKSTGADTNNGTSEATPFAHAPGMPSATGNAASATVSAGTGIILRGGETWTSSDITWQINHTGTSANPIIAGVDLTTTGSGTGPGWYNSSVCGNAWCRPRINGSGSSGSILQTSNSYVTFDNIEIYNITNQQNTMQFNSASNSRITELYVHAINHASGGNNSGLTSNCGSGTNVDHNIVDNSDAPFSTTPPNGNCSSGVCGTYNGIFGTCGGVIAYNYFSHVVSTVDAVTDDVHDNVTVYMVSSIDGDHCNTIFTQAPATGTTQLIYNNFINQSPGGTETCGGGGFVWFNGNDGLNSSWLGAGFNNVIVNTNNYPLSIGNHTSGNYGTYYWFNNTVDCSLGGCGGSPPVGPYWAILDQNNHFMPNALNATPSGGSSSPCSVGTGTGCTDLTQSVATANGQGYSLSQSYVYSPASGCTSSTCGTVQNGTNLNSTYCSTISGWSGTGTSAAGTACALSTTYGCAYNTSNHTLSCPALAPTTRPSTAAWDIGAYQFAPGASGGGTTFSGTITLSGTVTLP